MSVTLYVGGLGSDFNEQQLGQLLTNFRAIEHSRLITDGEGRCRGFAYVTFTDDLAAAKARVALNGRDIDGHILRVALAT